MQKGRYLTLALFLAGLIGLTIARQGAGNAYANTQSDSQAGALMEQATVAGRFDGAAGQSRLEGIGGVLATIPTGQATLALLESYHISVRFDTGHGSRFYKERNEIVMDSSQGDFSAALSLVHEATHARYFHEGLTATVEYSDREVYVQMKVEEEITAVESQVLAATELSEIGVDISKLRHVLYYQYQQAAGKASRLARYENPSSEESKIKEISQEAGREAITQVITSGEFVRSTDGQTYADYWGSVWDALSAF